MATNFHSELPNDQLHNPKDFSIARKNSVTTKDSSNNLKWTKANYTTVSTVTCQADVAGSLHLQYLCFYSTNDSNKYAVYFQITGLDILPIPTGYTGVIAVDLTASGVNSTAAQVGDAIQVALDAHANFTATDNNAGVVTVTGMTTATQPDSGSTSFDMVNIDTEVGDEFLQTDPSGNIKWGAAPGGGHTPEGTAILSTGEAGGVKFLREDGDGTCSWQIPTDTTGVNAVRLNDGTTSGTSVAGNVTLTIVGGIGITSTVSGTTITISETIEKKGKDDVENVIGTTETDLGVFTGTTIADSRDIKTALQDLETDHEVVKGTSYHHNSVRYSANNLDGTSSVAGTNDAWAFAEPNNNAHNRFFTACDTSAMDYQIAGKSCIEVPITGVTSKLVGGTLMGSGMSGVTLKVTIWKGDFDSTETNMPMTLMGTFTVVGSSNLDTDVFNISLGSAEDCTLADGDGVIILMEDIETQADVDCRGTVTLRFKDTF
jgi:hypothetical protein